MQEDVSIETAGPGQKAMHEKQQDDPNLLTELPTYYAIGDIHGRLDLLNGLLTKIQAHAAGRQGAKTLVFLGDYIDRGHDSAGVLDRLLEGPPLGIDRQVCLLGNHEDLMLRYMRGEDRFGDWVRNGGGATLRSYAGDHEHMDRHANWLSALPICLHEEGFYFVHAGIVPGRPLDQQRRKDQLWIRLRFLWSWRNHGAIVVHGHTIVGRRPDVCRNRISIDTGAFSSGVLTCAVLQPNERPEFLQTGARG